MLILLRNGQRAVNLDNADCIEVDPHCPCVLTVNYVFHGKLGNRKQPYSGTHVITFYLGCFRDEEGAKKALADILDAYEKGAKVYRIEQGIFSGDD